LTEKTNKRIETPKKREALTSSKSGGRKDKKKTCTGGVLRTTCQPGKTLLWGDGVGKEMQMDAKKKSAGGGGGPAFERGTGGKEGRNQKGSANNRKKGKRKDRSGEGGGIGKRGWGGDRALKRLVKRYGVLFKENITADREGGGRAKMLGGGASPILSGGSIDRMTGQREKKEGRGGTVKKEQKGGGVFGSQESSPTWWSCLIISERG